MTAEAKAARGLDPEVKRLRRLGPAELADEAFVLKSRIEAIKAEAIRRGLKTAEGQAGRITLSPPGTQERSDRALLTIKPRRTFATAA
jgi:hypothetical protein